MRDKQTISLPATRTHGRRVEATMAMESLMGDVFTSNMYKHIPEGLPKLMNIWCYMVSPFVSTQKCQKTDFWPMVWNCFNKHSIAYDMLLKIKKIICKNN